MKILYLAHPEADYGEYYLFNGLCHLFGSDSIVTYPFKKTYYGLIADDYILDDGKPGYTTPEGHITAKEMNEVSYEEVLRNIKSFDFVILSSGRTYAANALRQLRKDLGMIPRPLIFTEHEDGENFRFDILQEFDPDLFFKRELLAERPLNGAIPLPFSSANDSFPEFNDSEKTIDVFASFGATYPLRTEVIQKLIEFNLPNTHFGIDSEIRGDFQERNKGRLSYEGHLEMIAKSKIAVCVRGHGRDTVRQWEIPGYRTLMLICDPGIRIPNNFEDGKTAVFFKEDLSDLREKIDYYLAHDEERENIATAGREHMLKYHTNKARAEYFMNVLNERKVVKYV